MALARRLSFIRGGWSLALGGGDARTGFQFSYAAFHLRGAWESFVVGGRRTPLKDSEVSVQNNRGLREERWCARLAHRRRADTAPRTHACHFNTGITQEGYFEAFCGRLHIGTATLGFEVHPVFLTRHIMRMRFCEAFCLCAVASQLDALWRLLLCVI